MAELSESFFQRVVAPAANRDVAATIIDAAHEWNASAIVFTPRGGSRWGKLLSGDVTHKLVQTSDVPVLVLPDREVSDA